MENSSTGAATASCSFKYCSQDQASRVATAGAGRENTRAVLETVSDRKITQLKINPRSRLITETDDQKTKQPTGRSLIAGVAVSIWYNHVTSHPQLFLG